MPTSPLRLTVDLEVDGKQISGRAGDGLGQPERFTGWMGLISAVDRLLERDAGRAHGDDGAPEPETGSDRGV
ncbi:MAG TPA: hypothetical protein VGI50_07940 [Solirubrobacteraceae bacterium]|jgi:hypothetical protein